MQGEGVIGLRIPARAGRAGLRAAPTRTHGRFTLGARAPRRRAAQLDARSERRRPRAHDRAFGREGVVRWINDPEIGDRIAVALVGGPARGVDVRRATMEAAVLPAAHGAVIEPRADDVTVTFDAGALTVTRGEGLIAAAPVQSELEAGLSAAMMEDALGGAPMHAAEANNLAQVRERIDELTRRAADESCLRPPARSRALASERLPGVRWLWVTPS